MDNSNYSFDWKGFYFFITIFVIGLCVGVASYAGLRLMTAPPNAQPLATLAVVEQQATSTLETVVAPISSSTPKRIINSLTIADVVPKTGKFVAANLVTMQLFLYQDGVAMAVFPIRTKGRPGTAWETPSGLYNIATKEKNHFSSIGKVYMPYSMQFYGNYFIHGWTYYPDGTPTAASFSGGCIKLNTEDAERVFAFVDVGTQVFVYDSAKNETPPALTITNAPKPNITAAAYLIADLDTRDVYMEQDATTPRPIASITKLMTALVANEIISLDKKVTVEEGQLSYPRDTASTTPKTFYVNDLFYPLLMQSNNSIADSLAAYYGNNGFVRWMNTTARALSMSNTTYADPSGASADNISTPEDLFRLANYLTSKKSFVLKITHTQTKTLTALDGSTYRIANVNTPADTADFEGGKVGHTTAAKDTMLSVVTFPVGTDTRRIAVIVLGSDNQQQDTTALANWIISAAKEGSMETACASCATPPQYRKIGL